MLRKPPNLGVGEEPTVSQMIESEGGEGLDEGVLASPSLLRGYTVW